MASRPTSLVPRAIALTLALFGAGACLAADDAPVRLRELLVVEPYIELHEGPGRGYAVTQVVARGDTFEVLYRRTEWFRVRTRRGVEGWAHEREVLKARLPDGSPFTIDRGDRAGFTSHRFEMGASLGDYGGATLIGSYFAVVFNEQMQLELTGSQFLGDASNGYSGTIGLAHVYRPDWRISPLLTLGGGLIRIEPKATLVQPEDRTDQTAYAGAGVRMYLTRRFFLRAEYRHHMVFTSRNENEEINEWKMSFAFFF
jgi:opacity protein-like surface antigen